MKIMDNCLKFLSMLPLWFCLLFRYVYEIFTKSNNNYTEITMTILIVLGLIFSILYVKMIGLKNSESTVSYKEYQIVELEPVQFNSEWKLIFPMILLFVDFTIWYNLLVALVTAFIILQYESRERCYADNFFLNLIGYNFYKGFLGTWESENTTIYFNKIIACKQTIDEYDDINYKRSLFLTPINNDVWYTKLEQGEYKNDEE